MLRTHILKGTISPT